MARKVHDHFGGGKWLLLRDPALENLRNAWELHFTPPIGTLAPQIRSREIFGSSA